MIETKLNGKSDDIIYNNVQEMKNLFPEVFSEDKIDFGKLKIVLGGGENSYLDEDNERYDFTWKGKSESIKLAQTPSEGTLRPDKGSSKNWDTTENLYIEGDNLEVLKLLQKSYYGKIKMIYLDPPYNTGKDFVYEDNFTDNLKNYLKQDEKGFNVSSNPETSGRYHTNWLNMMYSRLKLCRNLLTENGVIFISIDENELFNLKKIMDEIFGEFNLITLITRTSNSGSKNDSKYFIKDNDYILIYAKNMDSINIKKVKVQNTRKYSYFDDIGEFNIRNLEMRGAGQDRLEDRPNMGYSIYYNKIKNDFIALHDYDLNKNPVYEKPDEKLIKEGYCCVRPTKVNKSLGRWRWGIETFLNNTENIYIDVEKKRAYTKERKKEYIETPPLSSLKILNTLGSNEIKELFDNKIFDFPKPTQLIEFLIERICENNDIIMDFFSGSATTGHSVLKYNIKNHENNKFLLVQLPEKIDEKTKAKEDGYNNICEIGKERIRRAGDKLTEENPDANIDIGFKVFKLDSSNLIKWNPDVDNLEDSLINVRDNIIEGRTELDLVYEIMLKYGLELTLPVEEIEKDNYTFYNVGMGSLVVCLNDHIKRDVATDVLAIKENLSPNIMRVVFKDNGFESDSDKTNVKEILRNNDVDEFITI